MRKKRKGSELLFPDQGEETVESKPNSHTSVSNLRSHYSLEGYTRLKKRCKEDIGSCNLNDDAGSCKKRLVGVAATAPPCGSSSLVLPGRGLKRKIGCIGVATQMGRKNKIEDDYIKGEKTLGKGKFGSVWLCRSRATGVEYACKTLRKGEETVHREVEIMQHLSGHPGVVTLEAVYEDSECFHLVMELCSGGRLIDQMAKEVLCSEHRAASIFKELMLVIKYCHEMGVVHRDVKPENILLTKSGKIKLADFGLAMRVANGQLLTGLAGSPGYVAPEVLTGNYSEKVDIWSAGVLLYALLTGALPFKGDSLESVFESIKTVKLDFHSGIWESVSKPARNLLERILTRDVTSRMTADEVLGHPWILFYTERTLKILSIKSKSKNQSVPPSEPLPTGNKLEQDESGSVNGSSGQNKSPTSSPGKLGYEEEEEEEDECGLVDALAVAISNVRISGPKRSRLCVPTSPIREQCSSNVTSNNLCKAF